MYIITLPLLYIGGDKNWKNVLENKCRRYHDWNIYQKVGSLAKFKIQPKTPNFFRSSAVYSISSGESICHQDKYVTTAVYK